MYRYFVLFENNDLKIKYLRKNAIEKTNSKIINIFKMDIIFTIKIFILSPVIYFQL